MDQIKEKSKADFIELCRIAAEEDEEEFEMTKLRENEDGSN